MISRLPPNAPTGPVYQAGTMSGNPVAMATGLATLKFIEADPHFYNRLNEMTSRLNEETISLFAEFDIPVMVNQVGSMISLHFTSKEVVDYESASTSDREIFANLFHLLLKEGIYLPPSPFESCFISAVMTDSDMDLWLTGIRKATKKLQVSNNFKIGKSRHVIPSSTTSPGS